MTDLPPPGPSVVHGRLGVKARHEDGHLTFAIEPRAQHLRHGVVRASVYAYLVDTAAGLQMDAGDAWTLTTDLSVRARVMPAPARIEARSHNLRQGRRNATSTVDITTVDGELVAGGAASFVTLERRPDDPPKPPMTPHAVVARFAHRTRVLEGPLREEAGIRAVEPDEGIVEVTVTRQLRNMNGTMQGAMVALVAEAAAEDLVEARFGVRAVVSELDVRYLNRVEGGRVRSSCRVIGNEPTSPIEVRLHDLDKDRTTTLVYARAVVVD